MTRDVDINCSAVSCFIKNFVHYLAVLSIWFIELDIVFMPSSRHSSVFVCLWFSRQWILVSRHPQCLCNPLSVTRSSSGFWSCLISILEKMPYWNLGFMLVHFKYLLCLIMTALDFSCYGYYRICNFLFGQAGDRNLTLTLSLESNKFCRSSKSWIICYTLMCYMVLCRWL